MAARSPSCRTPAWKPTSGRSRAWTSAPTVERDQRLSAGRAVATASSAWSWARGLTTRRSITGCDQGAPVEGYVGFAIGRSIWGVPLDGFIDGSLTRDDAAAQVADNYLRFVEVYATAEAPVG